MTKLKQRHNDLLCQGLQMHRFCLHRSNGKFSITSSRGFKYTLMMCKLDSNQILLEPMKSRTEEMIRAHKALIQCLKAQNICPKLQFLDNEASKEYKKAICKEGLTVQLLTPHMH